MISNLAGFPPAQFCNYSYKYLVGCKGVLHGESKGFGLSRYLLQPGTTREAAPTATPCRGPTLAPFHTDKPTPHPPSAAGVDDEDRRDNLRKQSRHCMSRHCLSRHCLGSSPGTVARTWNAFC